MGLLLTTHFGTDRSRLKQPPHFARLFVRLHRHTPQGGLRGPEKQLGPGGSCRAGSQDPFGSLPPHTPHTCRRPHRRVWVETEEGGAGSPGEPGTAPGVKASRRRAIRTE